MKNNVPNFTCAKLKLKKKIKLRNNLNQIEIISNCKIHGFLGCRFHRGFVDMQNILF